MTLLFVDIFLFRMKVIALGGDSHLGGQDITQELANRVSEFIGKPISEMESSTKEKLIRTCERAKVELSNIQEVS